MVLACSVLLLMDARSEGDGVPSEGVSLPAPMLKGSMSLEEAIRHRRSLRQFADRPLTQEQIGQLCWAAQGITDPESGHRTAPSAGALYPIDLYVVTREGVSLYVPKGHLLRRHKPGDVREALAKAGLRQEAIQQSGACFVITAVPERSARKYAGRAERYCLLEAGHIAQNILLQATAMRLGGVPMGAVHDDAVAQVLGLAPDQRILYVVPVGHPR
jgi:SagB-type dehydrogenase family enzyme